MEFDADSEVDVIRKLEEYTWLRNLLSYHVLDSSLCRLMVEYALNEQDDKLEEYDWISDSITPYPFDGEDIGLAYRALNGMDPKTVPLSDDPEDDVDDPGCAPVPEHLRNKIELYIRWAEAVHSGNAKLTKCHSNGCKIKVFVPKSISKHFHCLVHGGFDEEALSFLES